MVEVTSRKNLRNEAVLKQPPHSFQAEQAIIGGLMLDNQALDKIMGGVKYAMIDQKQQGSSEDRQRIFQVLEKRGIELIKLSK